LSSQIPLIFQLDEVGYGDSYVLYDLVHFLNTGVIYRDLSQAPYVPSQYSPLMYMLFSLPGWIVSLENPFIGPRLFVLAAFLFCVAVVISIVRVLIPARYAWVWGLLLATSITGFQDWQNWLISLRGDLPGIAFSLLALRLLLARSRYAVMLAGLCAGLAMQFKITLVSALAAGFSWLLFQKRWRELAAFAAAGTLTSLGLYLLFWVREPRMVSQMMALSPGIADLRGCLKLTLKAIGEPITLLSLLAIPPVASHSWPGWAPLFLFAPISFVIGGLVDIQAGGNINYFFEALLALVPVAVLGLLRLIHWARRRISIAVFLSAAVLFDFLPPKVLDLYHQALYLENDRVAIENNQFRKAQEVLKRWHLFSTVPRLALLDSEPALTEPYLMSYIQRLGKFDPQPILERIRSGEFDVVITAAQSLSHRGIPHITPDLHRAIEDFYQPQCTMLGALIHVPRDRLKDSERAEELSRAGCVPVPRDGFFAGPSW
jgi:hypothetical protein